MTTFKKIILTTALTLTTTLSLWGIENTSLVLPNDIFGYIMQMLFNDLDDPQVDDLVDAVKLSMSCTKMYEASNHRIKECFGDNNKPENMSWWESLVVTINTIYVINNKTFKNGHIANKWLRHARFDLICPDTLHLPKTNLYGANFSGADFSGANFSGANLFAADFSGTELVNINFSGANLCQAKFYETEICFTNLEKADLTDAKLISVHITEINLRGTIFTGAKIKGGYFWDHMLDEQRPVTLEWLKKHGAIWDKENPPTFE